MAIQNLNLDELRALLQVAKAHRERNWLMILVAFAHGLRVTEVVGLTRDNFRDGYLTVQRLKGSEKTTQPLIEHADPLLDERSGVFDYLANFDDSGPLFKLCRQHFWRLVQRYGKAAGVPAHLRHPHVLKHSIAMQMIHSAGIENTRQYLGHKTMASTGEYLKVTDEAAARAARRALDV